MYAIIKIAGKQAKVVPDGKLVVNRLHEEEGAVIENKNVLLLDDGDVKVGNPYVDGASVKLEVVRHFKGKKVIVFKKRRRKGSKVKRGFRPHLTVLKVKEIVK